MKIAVVGAGLGGCITAMYYGLYNTVDSDVEVTISVSYTHLTLPTILLV